MVALYMDFVINTVYRNKQLPLVSDATHISQVPVLKALLFMFQSFPLVAHALKQIPNWSDGLFLIFIKLPKDKEIVLV